MDNGQWTMPCGLRLFVNYQLSWFVILVVY